MAFGQKPTRPTTKPRKLVELKDTCKTLDETIKVCTERKSRLEILIKALSEEEGNLKGDDVGEEDANEEGIDASDDEETTNSDEDGSGMFLLCLFLCFVREVNYLFFEAKFLFLLCLPLFFLF